MVFKYNKDINQKSWPLRAERQIETALKTRSRTNKATKTVPKIGKSDQYSKRYLFVCIILF